MDRFRIPTSLDGPIVGLLILIAWEAGVRIGGVPAYLLPPPSAIAQRLFTDWDSLLYHFAATTLEVVIGFVLAIVVSIPLAALLAQIRIVERMLYPVLVASQADLSKKLAASGDSKRIVTLFLGGVAIQIAVTMLYKSAMWYTYFGAMNPAFRSRWRYRSAEWISEQHWLEVIFDVATMGLFVAAMFSLLQATFA